MGGNFAFDEKALTFIRCWRICHVNPRFALCEVGEPHNKTYVGEYSSIISNDVIEAAPLDAEEVVAIASFFSS